MSNTFMFCRVWPRLELSFGLTAALIGHHGPTPPFYAFPFAGNLGSSDLESCQEHTTTLSCQLYVIH